MFVGLSPGFVTYLVLLGLGAMLAIVWVLCWGIRQLIKVLAPHKVLFTKEQRQYYTELRRRYAEMEEISR